MTFVPGAILADLFASRDGIAGGLRATGWGSTDEIHRIACSRPELTYPNGVAIGRSSSKGPYVTLPKRDTTPVALIAHYLTWRLHLPYLACYSHCLI